MIADAIDKVGKDGVITVEESQSFGMDMDLVEGMRFDKGFIAPYFATDTERMEAVLENAYILLVSSKITSVRDVLPILEKVMQSGRPLLIIAEDVEGEALATLVVNKSAAPSNPLPSRRRVSVSVQGHAPGHRDPDRWHRHLRGDRAQARRRGVGVAG